VIFAILAQGNSRKTAPQLMRVIATQNGPRNQALEDRLHFHPAFCSWALLP